MIGKLDHLVATGITALELMPLADFAGRRNWGYDGVLWYAPDSAYGRPDDLKALIDEAHLRGLMVFLDVVYNHFGPEGNYLGRYAPGLLYRRADTMGQRDRLSGAAGTCLRDRECAVLARANTASTGCGWMRSTPSPNPAKSRCCTISATRSANSPRQPAVTSTWCSRTTTTPRACWMPAQDPPRGKYRAQWNDDYHHAWHVLLTGESHGYYRDYQRSPLHDIARALGSGFVYQGEASAHRGGQLRGEPSGELAPDRLRQFPAEPRPDRQPRARRPAREHGAIRAIEAALAITLLAPMIPMLFMGEEWGSKAPFPFFCDFQRRTRRRRTQGRRRNTPAPMQIWRRSPRSARRSDLSIRGARLGRARRSEGQRTAGAGAQLLAIRRREIVPRLAGAAFGDAQAADNGLLTADWRMGDGTRLSADRPICRRARSRARRLT